MKARCIFRMYIWGEQQVLYKNFCPCTSLKARTPQHVTWPSLLKWKKPYNSPFKKITLPCIMNNNPSVLISKILYGVTDHTGIRTLSGIKISRPSTTHFLTRYQKFLIMISLKSEFVMVIQRLDCCVLSWLCCTLQDRHSRDQLLLSPNNQCQFFL